MKLKFFGLPKSTELRLDKDISKPVSHFKQGFRTIEVNVYIGAYLKYKTFKNFSRSDFLNALTLSSICLSAFSPAMVIERDGGDPQYPSSYQLPKNNATQFYY